MKQSFLVTIGLALFLAGCAQEEAAESAIPAEAAVATAENLAPWEADDSWRDSGFMQYMHMKAEKLDEINFALADDDLQAAIGPARWLATHDTYEEIQSEWLPYQYAMRDEAQNLVAANDLTTARAAAERINESCQACHEFIGIEKFNTE